MDAKRDGVGIGRDIRPATHGGQGGERRGDCISQIAKQVFRPWWALWRAGKWWIKNQNKNKFLTNQMAEGQGFEPWIRSPAYTLSKRAPSTTRPPLRKGSGNISTARSNARTPGRKIRHIQLSAFHPILGQSESSKGSPPCGFWIEKSRNARGRQRPARPERTRPHRRHPFRQRQPLKGPYPDGFEKAAFGLGCFWGPSEPSGRHRGSGSPQLAMPRARRRMQPMKRSAPAAPATTRLCWSSSIQPS